MVLAVTAGYAAMAGWWTPRGPNDTTEALAAMVASFAVGVLAGALLRSRWAMVLCPAVFVLVFELVRMDATGATVDRIDLSNEYGIMAFVVGRLFHGLLALLPMAVGVAWGRRWANHGAPASVTRRRTAVRRMGTTLGNAVLAVSSALILLLAVALLRPASTEPILGPAGEPLAGSIAELTRVRIDGFDQTLLIRGQDRTNPVLLFLAGGPGGSELGAMSRYARPLERHFVVVTWDQLGTGRSTGQFDPEDTLSFERAVSDTIAVSEHLRDRFGDQPLYLVANSYGSLLGVTAASHRPDLYAAFVGTGQMVNVVETDRIFYEDALAYAKATGDTALADTLIANGPPPYDDLLEMAPLVSSEHTWNDYSDIEGFPGRREPTDNLFVPEYALMDQVRSLANLLDTYVALYPDLYDVDLRTITSLEVPVYLVQGKHEARGRAVLAQEWFDRLEAPNKEHFVFERSGHRPWVQEPERFAEVMTDTVLSRTASDVTLDGSAASEPDSAADLRHLFADYNPAVWPGHVVAYLLGLAALGLIVRRPGTTDRFVTVLLVAAWAWLGIVFFGRYAAQQDPLLSAVYGALFVFQAMLFARAGLLRDRLRFVARNGIAGVMGWVALAYALVVYPLLGMALGHGYPESPLFGMAPCPTTIATFGLLLLVRPPLPRHLLVVPMIWAVLAPLAAVGHGYPEDIGLAVAGLAALVATLVRPSTPNRHRREAAETHDRPPSLAGHPPLLGGSRRP